MAESALDFINDYRSEPEGERRFRDAETGFDVTERMTELRRKSGISQTELGKRVGCTQPFIAKLEAGGYDRCRVGLLQTFANAMGYALDVNNMFAPAQEFYTGNSAADELAAWLPDDLPEDFQQMAVVLTQKVVVHAKSHVTAEQIRIEATSTRAARESELTAA